MHMIVEIIGWIGATLVLVAYFLVSTKKVAPTSIHYQLMNLIGAITVGINVFVKGAYPSLLIEIVWTAIAAYGFYQALKR